MDHSKMKAPSSIVGKPVFGALVSAGRAQPVEGRNDEHGRLLHSRALRRKVRMVRRIYVRLGVFCALERVPSLKSIPFTSRGSCRKSALRISTQSRRYRAIAG